MLADLHLLRVRLRHLHVEAQPVGLHDREQRAARVAGTDEIADVDVALRDDPVDRRGDPLEAFQLGEAAHVRIGRGEVRGAPVERALPVVEFLLRDGIALAQLLRAVERRLRERECGLRLLALRGGLREFRFSSGVSSSASVWPCFTCAPMSACQRSTTLARA